MQFTENISWLDTITSLFSCPADNYGRPRTFRQILFTDFGVPHNWFYKVNKEGPWISGNSNDLDTIVTIRKGTANKVLLKQTIQCYTPSAYYKCKKKGHEVIEKHKEAISKIMQTTSKKISMAKSYLDNMVGFGLVIRNDDGYYRINMDKVNLGQNGSI